MAPAGALLTCTAAGLGAGGVGTAGGAGATRWAGVDAVGAAGGVGATRWAGVDAVGAAGGVGATRWAGADARVDAGIEGGNLKLVRFLITASRLLTFMGGFCSMVARAAVSCLICPGPLRRNCCQLACR